MKKMTIVLFALLLLLILGTSISYAQDISVVIDGKTVESDVPPRILNGRTVLPMRAIFESLGATVEWFDEDKLIFATKDDSFITMQIGSYEMILQKIGNNEKNIINLDIAPFIKNNRTLVPVRAVAEALDADVQWDAGERRVIITTI